MAEVYKGTSSLVTGIGSKPLPERFSPQQNHQTLKKAHLDAAHIVEGKVEMRKIKVKSNSHRDSTLVIGHTLVVHFKQDGIGYIPEDRLDEFKAHARVRPGRFKIFEEKAKVEEAPEVVKNAAEELVERLEAARAALLERAIEVEVPEVESPVETVVFQPESITTTEIVLDDRVVATTHIVLDSEVEKSVVEDIVVEEKPKQVRKTTKKKTRKKKKAKAPSRKISED